MPKFSSNDLCPATNSEVTSSMSFNIVTFLRPFYYKRLLYHLTVKGKNDSPGPTTRVLKIIRKTYTLTKQNGLVCWLALRLAF